MLCFIRTTNDLLIIAICLFWIIVYYAIVHGILSIAYYFLSKKFSIFKTKWKFLFSFIVALTPVVALSLMTMRYSYDFFEITDIQAEYISNKDDCLLHDTTSTHLGISLEFNGDYVPGANAKKTLSPAFRRGWAGIAYPIKKIEVKGYENHTITDLTHSLNLKNNQYIEKYDDCWNYYKYKIQKESISLSELIEDLNSHKRYTQEITAESGDIVPLWLPDTVVPSKFDSIVIHAVFTNEKGDFDIYKTVKQKTTESHHKLLTGHSKDHTFSDLSENAYFPLPSQDQLDDRPMY